MFLIPKQHLSNLHAGGNADVKTDIWPRRISPVHELEPVSLMDSDPSHCFTLLTARGRLSITRLLSARRLQNSKPRRDFHSCDSGPNKLHSQQNRADLAGFGSLGSSLINVRRDCISWQSKSLKCYNINEISKAIKHLDGMGLPPRLYAATLCWSFDSDAQCIELKYFWLNNDWFHLPASIIRTRICLGFWMLSFEDLIKDFAVRSGNRASVELPATATKGLI